MAYCCARRKALGGLLLAGITVGTGVVGWKRFAAAPVELPEAEVDARSLSMPVARCVACFRHVPKSGQRR